MSTSKPPPFAALAPDGSRIVVHPHASSDSVDELARALDVPATSAVAVDGRVVQRHERLIDVGLRVGSSITMQSPRCGDEDGEPPPGFTGGVDVAVVTGPACTSWRSLEIGRHTVGRAASADVRLDDAGVELHHGVIDVGGDADVTVSFTQLTGRVPATVDGHAGAGPQPISPNGIVRLGGSELMIRPGQRRPASHAPSAGSVVAAERDPWRRVVRRGPATSSSPTMAPIEIPEPPGAHRAPPLTSLVGASVAVAGAGVLAAVLGQAMFAMFAAIGAVASFATWAVGAAIARRDRRRSLAAHHDALAAFAEVLRCGQRDALQRHRAAHPGVVDVLDIADGDGCELWSRRVAPTHPMRATVGTGTCRWRPPIDGDRRGSLDPAMIATVTDAERLPDVSVPVTLAPRSVLALHGPASLTAALCRSIVVQFAVNYGPADWEVIVVSDQPERWSWAGWLPHARSDAASVIDARDTAALATALADPGTATAADTSSGTSEPGDDVRNGHDGQLLVVLDVPELLTTRTGPMRRRFDRGDVSFLVVVPPEVTVPAMATQVLDVGATATGRWVDTDEHSTWDNDSTDIAVAGISRETAEAVALRLAPLVDPEQHDVSAGVRAAVTLAELEPMGADASTLIARRWQHGGRDPQPVARVGMSADGVVDIDLGRDGPHGLIAGTTGAGKSELLRTLVVSLAAHVSPDHLTMVLVDFKGGSTFDACARLPHTVGVVTDLDDGLAERVLVSLDAEVRRRERLLRSAGVDDLTGYRRAATPPLPRLVVVIDEFASLAKELPDFLHALVDVAQRGRSLGVHLLLATQRPAGVVTDDIRANTNLRIALRLQDRRDAIDVVGDGLPATFPVGSAGRAALRLGPDDLVMFQTANSSTPVAAQVARLSIEWSGRAAPRVPGSVVDAAHEPRSMLEQLTDSICDAAVMVGIEPPHRPWIDALPELLTAQHLAHALDSDASPPAASAAVPGAMVGLVDDPANQCRVPLRWQPGDGNVLLVGGIGAGTTTTAAALATALAVDADPTALHVYVIDAHGDDRWSTVEHLDHCGAVIRLGERERLSRLLRRLARELDRRAAIGERTPQIVLVLDGAGPVRELLGAAVMDDSAAHLDRALRDGPALGLSTCITTDGSSSGALSLPRSSTWVFRLDDPSIARSLGVAVGLTATVPGRLRLAETGLEAQVAFDPRSDSEPGAPHRDPPNHHRCGWPQPIRVLPELVDTDRLDAMQASPTLGESGIDGGSLELVVGLGADDLTPVSLRVPVGDHVFIAGGARTGRSTALRQIEAAWRIAHPDGRVEKVDRRRCVDRVDPEVIATGRGLLVVVDDADRVDDVDGRLGALVASGAPGVTVAVAARLEAVRVAYGHWTRDVARSRCGLIMTSTGDIDGELLGVTLPRRSMIPPRPGLAWLIDQSGHRLVQVAARMPP